MERKTVLEKVSTAMVASNLQLKEHVSPIDYVIAAGMVAQHHPEASEFISFNSIGNAAGYRAVRKAAIQITHKLNNKRHWNLNRDALLRVADSAVKMYLIPRCQKCHGRKYETIPDTPSLSIKKCQKCKGTGNRAYPVKDELHIRDVVQVICSIVDVAEKAIERKSRTF